MRQSKGVRALRQFNFFTIKNLRHFIFAVWLLMIFLGISFLIALLFGAVPLFIALLTQVAFSLGGRAISVTLIRVGFSGTLALGIGLAVRALLAAEATPYVANAVSPGREPDLDLRLGPPGVQVEDPEGLSPAERRLKDRLALTGRPDVSVDDLQAMLLLKNEIVSRVSQLDPHPFWEDRKEYIMSNCILTPQGYEYALDTLEKILRGLQAEGAKDHYFVKRMIKVRGDILLTGRYYGGVIE